MSNQGTPPPDWKVGDQVAVTKDHHPTRRGIVTRVMSLHVMVSCDSRLLKFSKKTGRKVAPFAQYSVWIKPWTSRDEDGDQHLQLERNIRASFNDLSTQLGTASTETLHGVYDLVKEIHNLLIPTTQDTTKE